MSVLKVKTHSVIHDTIEGEAVVMNLEAGVYYSFNLPATSIWEYVLEDSPYEEDLLKAVSGLLSYLLLLPTQRGDIVRDEIQKLE